MSMSEMTVAKTMILKKVEKRTMRKTTYENIIKTLESMSDVRIINRVEKDENLSTTDAIHFEFIALNNDRLQSNDNKRYSVKANTVVVNQLCAECLSDADVKISRLYKSSSKNYANIVITSELSDLLAIVRNAHYESLALKIENALEIEFKTTVKKATRSRKKAQ